MVGTVVKAKIVELEEHIREVFFIRNRKEMTGVVQGVSGRKMLLVNFTDVFENYLRPNQLTIMIVEKIPVEEEPEVPTIPEIPEDKATSENGNYHGVYVILYFNK